MSNFKVVSKLALTLAFVLAMSVAAMASTGAAWVGIGTGATTATYSDVDSPTTGAIYSTEIGTGVATTTVNLGSVYVGDPLTANFAMFNQTTETLTSVSLTAAAPLTVTALTTDVLLPSSGTYTSSTLSTLTVLSTPTFFTVTFPTAAAGASTGTVVLLTPSDPTTSSITTRTFVFTATVLPVITVTTDTTSLFNTAGDLYKVALTVNKKDVSDPTGFLEVVSTDNGPLLRLSSDTLAAPSKGISVKITKLKKDKIGKPDAAILAAEAAANAVATNDKGVALFYTTQSLVASFGNSNVEGVDVNSFYTEAPVSALASGVLSSATVVTTHFNPLTTTANFAGSLKSVTAKNTEINLIAGGTIGTIGINSNLSRADQASLAVYSNAKVVNEKIKTLVVNAKNVLVASVANMNTATKVNNQNDSKQVKLDSSTSVTIANVYSAKDLTVVNKGGDVNGFIVSEGKASVTASGKAGSNVISYAPATTTTLYTVGGPLLVAGFGPTHTTAFDKKKAAKFVGVDTVSGSGGVYAIVVAGYTITAGSVSDMINSLAAVNQTSPTATGTAYVKALKTSKNGQIVSRVFEANEATVKNAKGVNLTKITAPNSKSVSPVVKFNAEN